MKRIETTIGTVKKDIGNFYQFDKQHFIVMNAVDLGEKLEIQWFFSDYNSTGEVTAYCAQVNPGDEIPSLKSIIPSAWVAEAELADLMDIKIEDTARGFVLEPDSEPAPLRKKK
ncbi:MAG TPA: NADH-quinone oxidoreductase subunit C [Chitinophagaceae bacterium]